MLHQSQRAALVAALSCVDYVVVFEEATPDDLLACIQPDVLVKGGTYGPEEVVGREVVEAYGGEVRVVGCVDGVSTTRLLATARSGPAALAAV